MHVRTIPDRTLVMLPQPLDQLVMSDSLQRTLAAADELTVHPCVEPTSFFACLPGMPATSYTIRKVDLAVMVVMDE